MLCKLSPFIAAVVLSLFVAGCQKAPPDNVAATVNGRPITYAELDQQYKVIFTQQEENVSDEQVAIQKVEILRSLIDREIMLQRAEKLSLMAVDVDVDAKFTELRSPFTEEEFQKQLQTQNMTEDDLRAQLHRDLSIQKLFNKEITSHISISDKDVKEFYEANKASFNLVEPQIHLAQILVTPHPDPNVRNLRSDKAQNPEQAKAKIGAIEARLRQGEDFSMLAQSYSEDPNTAPNGGDLGIIQESQLEQASVEIRRVIMKLQPSEVSGIVESPEGYRILKLIAREPAGQRELDDPRVQQTIRERLLNRKDQLLRAAYYEVARNEANVVNYYALKIDAEKGVSTE
jgi:peptidyl-prolyl cis-trans isomerase SurA